MCVDFIYSLVVYIQLAPFLFGWLRRLGAKKEQATDKQGVCE